MINAISYNTNSTYKYPITEQPHRNYRTFNQEKVDMFVKQKESALVHIAEVLGHSQNEDEIVEYLYILDRSIENGTGDVKRMYPVLARFNQTTNPEIQTFLAGIYRKIQVPDAFGPLVNMLIKNCTTPYKQTYFDPNEEIGGAILSYINERFRK